MARRRAAIPTILLAVLFAFACSAHAAEPVAPTGILRVVYLASNPVQARRDPASGALSGVSVDLAHELGRRLAVPVTFDGRDIRGVIEAVRGGQADIGFLANDPSRHGPVVFSQTYLRNPQSIAVPETSPIRALSDIDRTGIRIGASKGDSIALQLARTLKSAALIEMDGTAASLAGKAFEEGRIDAFGASRQRLLGLAAAYPGLRILPGSLHGVPQAIIVAAGRTEALDAINAFLNEVRANGFLAASIARADNGTEMEPAP
jgi:polar amino acid transport system substrate-binding protein